MLYALMMLAGASLDSVQEQFPILPRDEHIVADAKKRWITKSGESDRAMEYRIPVVVDIIDERCVILYLKVPAVGGTPVYCYGLTSDVLRRSKDDVE
jgi:hypothetical protein